MFDHVVIGVSDYTASKTFFLKALEPLGVAVVQEGPLGVGLGSDYAAFVIGPDGHNIEAVCHEPDA